jgi:hypothetical protein
MLRLWYHVALSLSRDSIPLVLPAKNTLDSARLNPYREEGFLRLSPIDARAERFSFPSK